MESKTQGQGHKKNPRPRPRTALQRADPLEAKDRKARGQGLRTPAQVFSKKKVFKNFFNEKRLPKIFSGKLRNFNNSKKVLSSSRPRQANFYGLEVSRPRPRTWPSRPRPRLRTSKWVLEDVLEDKDVLEDSKSVNFIHLFKTQPFIF